MDARLTEDNRVRTDIYRMVFKKCLCLLIGFYKVIGFEIFTAVKCTELFNPRIVTEKV